ncbi:transient receptor potential cation channel subfamily A member 1 homolog isoform X1 [Lycorma delicatula]|uniref:transient receptor potential cation channel subfamily A member 1 homolog isoform X1 n=1 Tax=Lycorma delicatula TaxID=130591 RepID=UPI003F518256
MVIELKREDVCQSVAKLMAAINWSSYLQVKRVLESLSNAGLTVNIRSGSMRVLPLQLASSLSDHKEAAKIVKLLLQNGAQVNCCDKIGRTPLYHAATEGSVEVLKLLLEAGAIANSQCTVMPWSNNDNDCGFQSVEGVSCSREASAAILLPVPECWGRTPLHQAVEGVHDECVQLLLDKGADVNALDEKGISPLLLATKKIKPGDYSAIRRYENIVNQLISNGANVNIVCEKTKCTPLHHSLELASVTATEFLIANGADIRAQKLDGETPLHVAASLGNVDVLRFLVQCISNDFKELINYPDKVGYTPLHKAAITGNKDCLSILLDNGGDLAAETLNGVTVYEEIFSYIPRPVDFLIKILDSKIKPNDKSTNDHEFKVMLDFGILTPKDIIKQTSITSLFSTESRIMQHPLVEAFISLKWRKMRHLFFMLCIIQICFVITLSVYTYVLVHPEWVEWSETSDFFSMLFIKDWEMWFAIMLLIFGMMILIQSVIELIFLGRLRFKQIEPWLNIICPLYSIVLVLLVLNIDSLSNPRIFDFLCYIGSVIILCGWARVMFLLARIPEWGYYGLMFLAVLTNVIKVLTSFICLVIGFVFCFCIQFPNSELFSNPFFSFVKTTTMMAGEFDYEDLFEHGKGKKELYASRFIFLLFVLLATVVLMNLMVGLAVNDIQDLLIKGHVKCLIKQAEFISHFEKLMSHPYLQRIFIYNILIKRQHVPTTLVIDANASAANFKSNHYFPHPLLESIIGIIFKHQKKKKSCGKRLSIPPYISYNFSDPSESRQSNILNVDGISKSTPIEKELYTQMQEIKHMLQFIISSYQRNDSNSKSSSDDDDEEEFNSKVYAVLRRMSHRKKNGAGNVSGVGRISSGIKGKRKISESTHGESYMPKAVPI